MNSIFIIKIWLVTLTIFIGELNIILFLNGGQKWFALAPILPTIAGVLLYLNEFFKSLNNEVKQQ